MNNTNLSSNELMKTMDSHIQKQNGASEKNLKVLIDLAVNLWRLERAIEYLQLDENSSEKRRINRHLIASKESLLQLEIEYEDHTGDLVPDKGEYILKVIEYIPKEDITKDVVIETIKPSVYHHGKMVSPGEVFVGIPVGSKDSEENKVSSLISETFESIANRLKQFIRE